MSARSKVLALVASTFIAAFNSSGSSQAAPVIDRCAYLASIDPSSVREALVIYADKVMGKYVEHWTNADFANLVANAEACEGQPADRTKKVISFLWKSKIAEAQRRNAEINSMSLAIAAGYSKYWEKDEEFPACVKFLKWKRDDTWYTNNSEEIFGKKLEDMTPDELGFYRKISQECLPVMTKILERWRSGPDNAQAVVKSFQSSVDMEAQAMGEKAKEIPKSLRVIYNGRVIPYSFLRPTTRKVMERISAVERENRILPTNAIIQISRWAGQVVKDEEPGPDLEYAKLVQKIITQHMFKAAEMLGDPKDYSANPRNQ